MSTSLPPGLTSMGDLDRPIPAGAAFARLDEGAAAPKPGPDANWTLEPDRTLKATVLGMVEATDRGLRVRPLWTLSPDRMALSVDLHPLDFAGKPLTAQQVALALAGAFGAITLDTKALLAALEQTRADGTPQPGWVAVKGRPAKPGRDGRLELLFGHDKTSGQLREDGSIDFKQRGGHQQVEADTPIARLHPPTPGSPGADITGATLEVPAGKPLAIKAGDNVREVPLADGVVEYQAAITGTPELDQNTLRVSEILVVSGDVDLDSGNIASPSGSVEVTGSLRAGFTVSAGKNVEIKGLVEAADITAGQDVTVLGGILMGGENMVRAGGGVSAKFIHNAVIVAGGDVATRSDIIQSDITARGKVTANEGHGNVVGGVVRCRTGLLAKELGSETGVATLVEIMVEGPRTPQISARKEGIEKRLAKLDKGIGSEDALSVLMSSPDEDRRILAELIKLKSQAQTELKAVQQELDEDLAVGEQDLAAAVVQATGAVYPGVEVKMGRKSLRIDAPLTSAKFCWNPGRREIETG